MTEKSKILSFVSSGGLMGLALGFCLSAACIIYAKFWDGTPIYWPGMIANVVVMYLLPLAVLGALVGGMVWLLRRPS